MSPAADQTESVLGAATPRLYLASTSPRRRRLLEEYGYAHEVHSPGIDDSGLSPHETAPDEWVASLAYLKARAGVENLPDDGLVIGADTICVHDGCIIGQPEDRDDAARIIRLFENDEHEVLTGVAIVPTDLSWRDVFVDRATVRVGRIGDERIKEYLDTGEWRGKAGAYNLNDRLDAGWPIEFEGDPTSIIGLPMVALGEHLAYHGVTGGRPC